jgi:hypothetical protein
MIYIYINTFIFAPEKKIKVRNKITAKLAFAYLKLYYRTFVFVSN